MGNTTFIRTLTTALLITFLNITSNGQTLSITSLTPTSVIPGDTVTMVGAGFGSLANSYLDLSSAEATVISSTSTQIKFLVPGNAISGPVRYTNLSTNASVRSVQYISVLGDTDSSYVFSPPCDITGSRNNYGAGTYVTAISKRNDQVFSSGTFSDFDKDGDLDFIKIQENVSGITGSLLYIWKNNNTGSNAFSSTNLVRVERQVVENAENVSIFDANSDGKQDLIVTNAKSGAGGDNTVTVLINDYTTSQYIFKTSFDLCLPNLDMVKTIDVSGDGMEDVIGLRSDMDTIVIYENSTTGGSTNSFSLDRTDTTLLAITNVSGTDVTPEHIEVGDFDANGKYDIAATHSDGIHLFMNSVGSTTGWTSVHLSSNKHLGFLAVGDIDGDGISDLVSSPLQMVAGDSIYCFVNDYPGSGPLTSSHFNLLKIRHTSGSSPVRNYHISLADINWDGKMDLITSALNYGSSVGTSDHYILENRKASSLSLSSSDFGTNIAINRTRWALTGDYHPSFRHTFAADFNGDSIPDLVSFFDDGIEFQINSVAREPAVLEVTQIKGDSTGSHCSNLYGDTNIYKIYSTGNGVYNENADIKVTIPANYQYKVSQTLIASGNWSTTGYTSGSSPVIASYLTPLDTMYLLLAPKPLNTTTFQSPYDGIVSTDSLRFYFQKRFDNTLACRLPDDVYIDLNNTWTPIPKEIISINSGYTYHDNTCPHGDSLEFSFLSTNSDTLIYSVEYVVGTYFNQGVPAKIVGYDSLSIGNSDTLSVPYINTPFSSILYFQRHAYQAEVTDELGCKNRTASNQRYHAYINTPTLSLSPSSLNAGDFTDISFPGYSAYWRSHIINSGLTTDSVTFNDIPADTLYNSGSNRRAIVPAISPDTVAGYNDTLTYYYTNNGGTEFCAIKKEFEYKNTLTSSDTLVISLTDNWVDLLKGNIWDPYDDQTGMTSTIDLVGNDSNAVFQASEEFIFDEIEKTLSHHYYFRSRLGDSSIAENWMWIGINKESNSATNTVDDIDTYLKVNLSDFSLTLHEKNNPINAIHESSPELLDINPIPYYTFDKTNDFVIKSYSAGTDLDQNGQVDSWLEVGFDESAFNRARLVLPKMSLLYGNYNSQRFNGVVWGIYDKVTNELLDSLFYDIAPGEYGNYEYEINMPYPIKSTGYELRPMYQNSGFTSSGYNYIRQLYMPYTSNDTWANYSNILIYGSQVSLTQSKALNGNWPYWPHGERVSDPISFGADMSMILFTSDTAMNGFDYGGFDDQVDTNLSWVDAGAQTYGTLQEFTQGKLLKPVMISNSNLNGDYNSDQFVFEGIWGGNMGEDKDTIWFAWKGVNYSINDTDSQGEPLVHLDGHKWKFTTPVWNMPCNSNGSTSMTVYVNGSSTGDLQRYSTTPVQKYNLARALSSSVLFDPVTSQGISDLCGNYILKLKDDGGDSWHGNSVGVSSSVDGYSFEGKNVSFSSSGSVLSIPLSVDTGEVITFTFEGGYSYMSECSYDITETDGTLIYSSYPGTSLWPKTIPQYALKCETSYGDTTFAIASDTLLTFENSPSESITYYLPVTNSNSSFLSSLRIDTVLISGLDSNDLSFSAQQSFPIILQGGTTDSIAIVFQPQHDTTLRYKRDFQLLFLTNGTQEANACKKDTTSIAYLFGFASGVLDTNAPTILVQPVTIPLDSLGGALLTIADVNIGTTDSNDFSMNLSKTTFDCSDLGVNTVVFTATDNNGNVAYDTVLVTVVDNIAPWGQANDVKLYLDNYGSAVFDSTIVAGAFNDNCQAQFNFTPKVFDCNDVGAHLSAVSATDESGNISSINFIINVKDSTKPEIALFTDTVELSSTGQGAMDTTAVIDYIRDNCGINTIVFSDLDFTSSNLGLNTITVAVTDVNNNQSAELTDIWVIDRLGPNMKAKNVILPLGNTGLAVIDVTDIDNNSSDNIGLDSLYISTSSFSCVDLGDHWVILTGLDASGNSDTAWSKVTVVDQLIPALSVSNSILYLDSTGSASLTFAEVDNGTTDNCGIDTAYLSKGLFTCSDVGTNPIIATAVDSSSNSGSQLMQVTVMDTLAPGIALLSDTVELNNLGLGSLDTTAVIVYIRDNCGINTVVYSQLNYSVTDLGQNTLTVTVKDIHNNLTVTNTDIYVVDKLGPDVNVNDVVLPLNGNGTATITVATIDDNSSDNTGLDSLYITVSGYNCSDLGDHWVVLTGIDGSGNSDTAWSKVTVADLQLPIMSISNATIYLDTLGSAALNYSDVDNGTTDNCGIDTTYLSKEIYSCLDVGTNAVLASAVDSSSNIGTQVIQVVVLDTLAPDFSLSADTIVLYTSTACQAVATWSSIVSDNCSAVNLTSNYNSGNTFSSGITKVVTIASDLSGNSTSDSLFVFVSDTLKPFWINYPFVTQNIPSLTTCGSNVSWLPPTALDYCGLVTITSNYSSGHFFTGADTVVFTATDIQGNFITYDLIITIADVIAPTIMPISDTTVFADSALCITDFIYPEVTATDNCAIDTIYFVPSTGIGFTVGVNAITCYALDGNGNQTTESFNVTVVDDQLPYLILGPSDTILGPCNSIHSFTSPTFADNCGIQSVVMTAGGNSGNQFPTGTTTNTYLATDMSGNTATYSFDITVLPSITPALPSYGYTCDTDSDFDLTGGDSNFTFTGTYVFNNMFSPTTSGAGLHNVTYQYIDSLNCTIYGNFGMSVSVGPVKPRIVRITSTHLSTHQPYSKYQWLFNGNPINPNGDSQTFQATAGGIYKVRVWNDGGCANISDPYFAGVVSTEEFDFSDLEIYPNPTRGLLTIDLHGVQMNLDISLYTLTGEQIINKSVSGNELIRLDVSEFASGVYLLRLVNSNGIVRNTRILIQD